MGSIIEYIECPNCEHEAFSDFYYKTGEEYVNCNNCGYHYSATIKDRKSEEQLYELKSNCEQDDNTECLLVSRFVDGEKIVETIIDNGPQIDSAGFTVEDRE